MKALFELEWDDDSGEGWMNIFNLELCLFSKEHTKKELLRIRDLSDYEIVGESGDDKGNKEIILHTKKKEKKK